MSIRHTLLKHAKDYCAEYDISARAFCLAAGVDHRVLSKLERGAAINLDTIELLENYIQTLIHDGKLPSASLAVTGIKAGDIPTANIHEADIPSARPAEAGLEDDGIIGAPI